MNSYLEVPLFRRDKSFKISCEDSSLLEYKWYLSKQGYARRAVKIGAKHYSYAYAHRDIMPHQRGLVVDHINGDRLDNRRENLRIVTYSQNTQNAKLSSRNTTGFRGVIYLPKNTINPWRAKIHIEGKCYILGYFPTLEQAYAEYSKVFNEWFGESL